MCKCLKHPFAELLSLYDLWSFLGKENQLVKGFELFLGLCVYFGVSDSLQVFISSHTTSAEGGPYPLWAFVDLKRREEEN